MSKSTPTPWIDGPYGEIWVGIHRNAEGKWDEDTPAAPGIPSSAVIVASAKNPADRALILRAVNAFEPMREALRKIADLSEADDPLDDAIEIANAALRLTSPAEGDATRELPPEARVYGSAVNLGSDIVNLARAALEQKPPPVSSEDAACTDCGGTGITFQTERRCACQGPQKDQP